ncbi:MAG TPA: bifunctional GNAT family N-acetyltransferase/(deoxy)nucleoside triphosphate pyrophosphohydrolase [Alphaproteobacteria bacterium]|jgi:8-oxo-dGTP diphosphatase|nr:bifunctional GNAT family N-acetyltransferase/(deoxy)nucleoside triphosphate pyrophosphohydrolase [Alphaproteobacteria bacterium]
MPTTGAEAAAAPRLETDRLILRPPGRGDIEAIVALLEPWEVVRYTARIPHPYTRADAEAWLSLVERGRADGTEHVFGIAERAGGAFVGTVGLRVDRDRREGVIGFWLGKPYWGKGYATEAVDAALGFAFDELGLVTVHASNLPENTGSARVQDKLGLAATGRGTEPFPARGGDRAVVLRAIGRDAWRRRHPLPIVPVAAVALIDADGRVLLAQRPPGKSMAGLWEFPGGKIHDGETPEAALIRELKEELGIDVTESCLGPFTFASHRYGTFHLLMPLFLCRVWRGQVRPLEGQVLKWVRPADMAGYAMPPADVPLVAMLRDFL